MGGDYVECRLWVVTPHGSYEHQRFEGNCRIHPQGKNPHSRKVLGIY
jgi:hypothetical protein